MEHSISYFVRGDLYKNLWNMSDEFDKMLVFDNN